MSGKRIDGPAHRTVSVKAMPGVDRAVLARAFTRALANTPEVRFPTCTAFCDALAGGAIPELPLAIAVPDDEDTLDAVGPFLPEEPSPADLPAALAADDFPAPNIDDVKIVAEETNLTAAQPDFDAIDPVVSPPNGSDEAERIAVAGWNPSPTASSEPARFSGVALIIAALVGALFGFAGGYMARPRALQSGPDEQFAAQPSATNTSAPAPAAAAANVPAANASKEIAKAETPKTGAARETREVVKTGRLLVRSEPPGATVTVDGVEKGVTPLALRDVEFGTRVIAVTQRGYTTETRRVAISAARPSRSMDVKLVAARAVSQKPVAPKRSEGGSPAPSTPATLGKPLTGGLAVDSRPAGASVTINGKPSGTTPLTVDDLPPGDYRIVMSMPGFRNFAATVRVVAGERARAAYSLTAQEQE